jgi:hypothetical protein
MNATKTAEIISLINVIRDAEAEWVAQGGIDAIGLAEVDCVASACGVTAEQVIAVAVAAGIQVVSTFRLAA